MSTVAVVVIFVLSGLSLVFFSLWRTTVSELDMEKAIAGDEAEERDKWRGIARQRGNALRRVLDVASEAMKDEGEVDE